MSKLSLPQLEQLKELVASYPRGGDEELTAHYIIMGMRRHLIKQGKDPGREDYEQEFNEDLDKAIQQKRREQQEAQRSNPNSVAASSLAPISREQMEKNAQRVAELMKKLSRDPMFLPPLTTGQGYIIGGQNPSLTKKVR
jgi:hypothetical protein